MEIKLLLMCDPWLICFVALERKNFQPRLLHDGLPFLPKSAVSYWRLDGRPSTPHSLPCFCRCQCRCHFGKRRQGRRPRSRVSTPSLSLPLRRFWPCWGGCGGQREGGRGPGSGVGLFSSQLFSFSSFVSSCFREFIPERPVLGGVGKSRTAQGLIP